MASATLFSLGEFKQTLSDCGTISYIHIPGFAYNEVDFKDQHLNERKPSDFSLLKHAIFKGVVGLWLGGFMYDSYWGVDGSSWKAYEFLKFLRVEFTQEYKRAFRRYKLNPRDNDVPMAVTAHIVHLGNTSGSHRVILRNANTGVYYGSGESIHVHVDTDTRKPSPYPDYIREKYASVIQKKNLKPVQVMSDNKMPTDCKIIWDEVTIEHSMIDHNNHTNIDFYLIFALDAVEKAVKQGQFPGYTAPDNEVKSVALLFKGESLLGDVLAVGVWNDQVEQDKFHCVIRKDAIDLVTVEVCVFDNVGAASATSRL